MIEAGLVFLGGYQLSKHPLVIKMLGPTADLIGEELEAWTAKRMANVGAIFAIGSRRLGQRIDENGSVPPRVLKGILDEGAYADDVLTSEYFGGLLASSRGSVSRDDRGSSLIAMVGRLSTYQIRLHYVLYLVLKTLYDGKDFPPTGDRPTATFIPEADLFTAMEFVGSELDNTESLMGHALNGLQREALIGDLIAYGNPEVLAAYRPRPLQDGSGLIYTPSGLGIELFLWAHGVSNFNLNEFLKIELTGAASPPVSINVGGAVNVAV